MLRSGKVEIPVDYSVSLDTMAVSYIEPYLNGSLTRLPSDFVETFEFLASNNVQVDPVPYLLENIGNLEEKHKQERIFEKLKCYAFLQSLKSENFFKLGVSEFKTDSSKFSSWAADKMSWLFHEKESVANQWPPLMYWKIYCLLLKMVLLQLSRGSDKIEEKLLDFLGFMDAELSAIFFRETVIARRYFERGQELKFFSKIQKKKSDLIESLRNMAWDLLHIRNMELALTLRPNESACVLVPAFLTFDKRLIEIIDIYPLSSCAFGPSLPPLPFPRLDWVHQIAESFPCVRNFANSLFEPHRRKARESASKTSSIKDLVNKLEAEVASL